MLVEELQQLQEAIAIRDSFAPDAVIDVSPARSANSKTHVDVVSSFDDMVNKVKAECRREYAEVLEEAKKQVRKEFEDEFGLERNISALLLRRNLEDFAYSKIADILHVKVTDHPYRKLVEMFQRRTIVEEFSEEDYEHLKRSQLRRHANDMAHLDLKDNITTKCRDVLYQYLRKFGERGELERYEKFYRFAAGEFGYARR